MRGKKTELWEGGPRVPCFIRWPKGDLAKPQDISGLTQVQDILPTLLDLYQIKPGNGPAFDGKSLAPILRGEEKVSEDPVLIMNYSRMPGFLHPHLPRPVKLQEIRAGKAIS